MSGPDLRETYDTEYQTFILLPRLWAGFPKAGQPPHELRLLVCHAHTELLSILGLYCSGIRVYET